MDIPTTLYYSNLTTEENLRAQYEAIVTNQLPNYCLITLTLKHFSEYLHKIGHDKYQSVISATLVQICSNLRKEDFIVHIHYDYFCILAQCEHNLDALHAIVARIHFAVRDNSFQQFGEKLFFAAGFYPIQAPYTDYYSAQYYANLSRKGAEYRFLETNYDMYGVSYIDRQEAFRKLESSVEEAMNRGDFKLYLQPKVNVATGEVTGAEALVRWIDPERGMIPLCDFLPQMEKNGYIRDLDRYLFQIACSYMDRWLHNYGKKITISFNLDSAYFNGPFFMPEYTDIFSQYDLPPDCVCIEILESIVLDDMERLRSLVSDIYDFGFSCALDDFGSGFSSFNILTSIHLTELKIDRSLFQNIHNKKEQTLIRHIIEIAHDMGIVCVAEGIETQSYADYLKEIGCDYIQGFLYYRPMPIDEFEALFITQKEQAPQV